MDTKEIVNLLEVAKKGIESVDYTGYYTTCENDLVDDASYAIDDLLAQFKEAK